MCTIGGLEARGCNAVNEATYLVGEVSDYCASSTYVRYVVYQ